MTRKTKNLQITLPIELAKRLDEESEKVQMSRSAYMRQLIVEALEWREQKQALVTLGQTLQALTPEQLQAELQKMYGDPNQMRL